MAEASFWESGSPIRISGLCMLWGTVIFYTGLIWHATRTRRKQIDDLASTSEGPLSDARTLDEMLESGQLYVQGKKPQQRKSERAPPEQPSATSTSVDDKQKVVGTPVSVFASMPSVLAPLTSMWSSAEDEDVPSDEERADRSEFLPAPSPPPPPPPPLRPTLFAEPDFLSVTVSDDEEQISSYSVCSDLSHLFGMDKSS